MDKKIKLVRITSIYFPNTHTMDDLITGFYLKDCQAIDVSERHTKVDEIQQSDDNYNVFKNGYLIASIKQNVCNVFYTEVIPA